eukprot:Skav200192  [mRNA]  locus=scaffold2383:233406:235692:+ [translate_table: standard]
MVMALHCTAALVPRLWHMRFFVVGVQQFMFILPLMGVLDVYLGHRFDEDSAQKKFSGIVVTLSTMFGMWAFKSLLPLITDSIEGMNSRSLGSMEHFLLFQMMAAKLLEKVLPLIVPGNFEGDSWVMPHETFIKLLTGFIICVVQLSLATLGLQASKSPVDISWGQCSCHFFDVRAYVADGTMYPKVDYESELPPDALPQP